MKIIHRVALESTVITHGLPRPQNLELAHSMERVVRENHAVPVTIAVLDGEIRVGLTDIELAQLAQQEPVRKISRRDFAAAIINKETGGTTVAGTLFIAHRSNIRVLATGGIGGVHEIETLDISADLQALSDTPVIIVCAGAKAILDVPATLEYLETMSVPVIGYRTNEFPAFYSRGSGLPVSLRLETPEQVVQFAKTHWSLGARSSILVCQPLPVNDEIPRVRIDTAIEQAKREALSKRLHGQALTPFLLARLSELTNGDSLRANLVLLLRNAKLGAMIACAFDD